MKGTEIQDVILDQLKGLGSIKMMSWGSHSFIGHQENNREGWLKFKVNGHHFQGWVKILLRANDTYTIQFIKDGKIEKELDDVYFDQMVDIIDEKVEYIDDYGKN